MSEVLNQALRFSLEFGPNWLKQVDDRIRAQFPELTPAQARDADKVCRDIHAFAFKGIERVFHGELEEPVVRAGILKKWPWIDAENLSHLWSQGMYYAHHG